MRNPPQPHVNSFTCSRATANVPWGGDGSTLYICADMYLCRITTRTLGNLL